MNKTLLEISQTKNSGLAEVLSDWKNYDDETVLLCFSELKRRNVPINEQMQHLMTAFAIHKGVPLSEVESDFFNGKGFSSYEEYYHTQIQVLEKRDEDRAYVQQMRRERIVQLEEINKKQAKKDVLYGGLWFAGVLLVTLISLSSGHGGIIAYGAVIFGGIQFFRGLINS
ncbi:hypothetical protein [uncultured Chryseobacterium sp.]|uniref:hypothetical protein n=1 Tax=uncultured Chryseobacterium sp. TaxID=259322 RepID=UPI0025F6AD9E|nr:hypothetical protein [uncultured Chryseobacterium sp.]